MKISIKTSSFKNHKVSHMPRIHRSNRDEVNTGVINHIINSVGGDKDIQNLVSEISFLKSAPSNERIRLSKIFYNSLHSKIYDMTEVNVSSTDIKQIVVIISGKMENK